MPRVFRAQDSGYVDFGIDGLFRLLRQVLPTRLDVPDAMKWALILVAVGEATTGLALLIVPSLLAQLLLGQELSGVAIPIARVAGIALVALCIACWPGPPRVGMLAYVAVVMLYLAYLGFTGGSTGILLWPAVVVHGVLTALLIRQSTSDKETNT
jgi:hypothetical protein